MSFLTNLGQFHITEKEIKTIVEYLAIDSDLNQKLIGKIIKLGNCIKKTNNKKRR